MVVSLLALLGLVGQEPYSWASDAPHPPPTPLAQGVWFIEGSAPANREPTGATVIFTSDEGTVVFDTGRHPEQVGAIVRFLEMGGIPPLAAVVNSHWHLDHMIGNLAIAERWPDAPVYASDALDGAVGTFLEPSVGRSEVFLASGEAGPELAADIRLDIAAIGRASELRPDVVITGDGTLPVADGRLEVRLARHAVTAGDVWLYDPVSRVAAVGDLMTWPAPFLDTACADGWLRALDAVAATDFELVIPGHGPVVGREGFEAYRAGLAAFIDCARSERSADACAAQWWEDAGWRGGETDPARATAFATYYVGLLRANGGDSPYCGAQDS